MRVTIDPRQNERRVADRRVHDRRNTHVTEFLAYVGTTKYTELDIDDFLDAILGVDPEKEARK